MAANPPKEITEEREREAWRLRQQCWTEARIAVQLGVDQSTVSRMLARTRKKLARAFETAAVEMKAEQTEQLQHIAAEAMAAWEASKADAEFERTHTEAVGARRTKAERPAEDEDEDEGPATPEPEAETNPLVVVKQKTTHELRGQSGNTAYLDAARNALADIRDIWGLDAPRRNDVTTGGQPVKALIGVDIDKI